MRVWCFVVNLARKAFRFFSAAVFAWADFVTRFIPVFSGSQGFGKRIAGLW
jgi:hypothetical protein